MKIARSFVVWKLLCHHMQDIEEVYILDIIYYSLLKELLQLSLGGAWAAAWAEGLGGSLGGLFGAWAEAWARSDEIQCTRIVCGEFP